MKIFSMKNTLIMNTNDTSNDNNNNKQNYTKTMSEIFDKHNTDKNSTFHNYARQYEPMMDKYRTMPLKYLEIGVLNGGSLRAFREYFHNAQCIVGIDINNKCKQYENTEKNIFVEIGNANDKEFLKSIFDKYGSFDIVLDDGSHQFNDVIKTFENVFPLLNENGIYVVEDTCVHNDITYSNVANIITPFCISKEKMYDHLTYFQQFIPCLNYHREPDYCIDPFKINRKTDNIIECMIDKIEFGCSYIAIHKKTRIHWIN